MRMAGKVVIVTGSTRGIGKGIARCCAQAGAQVIVTGRSQERGEAVVEGIQKSGGEASFIRADLGEEDEVRALIEQTVKRYGKLTTLINNAASTDLIINEQDHAVDKHNTQAWEKILRICLTAVMWSSKYAIPMIRQAGGGSIIHIGSAIVYSGGEDEDAYMAAKSALIGLTRSMAAEYACDNITVNCLHPGFFAGDYEDLKTKEPFASTFRKAQLAKQWGEPEDMGWACVWLASNEGKFVTGTNIPIDGGMSIKSPVARLFGEEGAFAQSGMDDPTNRASRDAR
jgi:3-oxoacyl-[acyl-carrier protein] reductase